MSTCGSIEGSSVASLKPQRFLETPARSLEAIGVLNALKEGFKKKEPNSITT